jgi:hypothetical protein
MLDTNGTRPAVFNIVKTLNRFDYSDKDVDEICEDYVGEENS